MQPSIGISSEHTLAVAQSLSAILADEFLLYVKTRNAHWNVEGPDFHAKHLFFESQYEALEDVIDSVAERIRSIGHYAPATMQQYLQLTHLSEMNREANDGQGFERLLLEDHETIIMHLRGYVKTFAEDYKDAGSSDFATQLMETHEKMAWMLRAHLR
ncbi:starvation-inducible DNA-binding protein [Chitinophaga skermanii]|uniref:Starvation-inducible DNA-binding protein n=1 Tax=Chitinophaga skermanii TaxID=331697 RepID=A0A327QCU2_9BACT|nr:DNA starvation/stationary phase protection protein [Chitinophaga skermanii]RAJ02379.1 starvation-inducible DNA-binding protein [Chitinophaga skermanii]